jgi:hypothetical protein
MFGGICRPRAALRQRRLPGKSASLAPSQLPADHRISKWELPGWESATFQGLGAQLGQSIDRRILIEQAKRDQLV